MKSEWVRKQDKFVWYLKEIKKLIIGIQVGILSIFVGGWDARWFEILEWSDGIFSLCGRELWNSGSVRWDYRGLADGHRWVGISTYKMSYFFAFELAPSLAVEAKVESFQVLVGYEVDEAITYVAVVLPTFKSTFMSHGKYKKS